MDLLLLLRLSLLALALSGALALSLAEGSPACLLGTSAAGILSVLLHLRAPGRSAANPSARAIRVEILAALGVALMLYTLLPLREDNGWERHAPAVFARLFVALNALLLLEAPIPALLTVQFFSNLCVIAISGVLDPGLSLLLRFTLFTGATAWVLFVFSLWRAHEAFTRRSHAESSRRSARFAEVKPGAGNLRVPGRALLQGVSMTALLALACAMLGLFLYFSAPRLNDTVRWLSAWFSAPDRDSPPPEAGGGPQSPVGGTGKAGGGNGGTGKGSSTGFSNHIQLTSLGTLEPNPRPAFTARVTPYQMDLSDSRGTLLFRGSALSDYRNGSWLPPGTGTRLPREAGTTMLALPQPPGLPPGSRPAVQAELEGDPALLVAPFAPGPLLSIAAGTVLFDGEGNVSLPPENRGNTLAFTFAAPVQAHRLSTGARARLPGSPGAPSPDAERYTDPGVSAADRERLMLLARELTAGKETDLERALAIENWLRSSERFSYTLSLNELKQGPEPVMEFLFSSDPLQRRGHCGFFATAFVLLCRAKGLPARMVSGYAVPAPLNPSGESVRVTARQSDAHAWGEVFFEHTGWVAFDPTRPAGLNPALPPGTELPPDPPSLTATARQGGVGGAWQQLLDFDGEKQRELYGAVGGALGGGVDSAGAVFAGSSATGWIGAALAWVAVLAVLLWLSRLFLHRSARRGGRFAGQTARQRAAVTFYNDLLQVLSRCGYVRRPEQTAREFAEHVIRAGGESFAAVRLLTDIFERVRYGGGDLSQEQFNQMQEALDRLRDASFAASSAGASVSGSAGLQRPS